MENENEFNLDSQNQIKGVDEIDFSDTDVAKEAYKALFDNTLKVTDTNKQLYARTKKAEGFEQKDGKWVKAEKPQTTTKPSEKSTNLSETDYGLLAFLTAKGLEHEDDINLFNKVRTETGKKPEEILSSKYFQAELKEQQEIRTSKEAQPKGNQRSGSNARDDAEYWNEKVKSGKATMDDVPEGIRFKVVELKVRSSSESSSLLDKIATNLKNK
jgi:hypothetical protein